MPSPMIPCSSTVSGYRPLTSSDLRFEDSGHGGQTKDLDGDEEDGYDEGGFYLSLSA